MHKVRTARGDMIDFDEVRVKQTLAATPSNIQVKAREEFVDHRLKRKSKRRAAMLSNQMLLESEETAIEEVADVDETNNDEQVGEVNNDQQPTRTKIQRPKSAKSE